MKVAFLDRDGTLIYEPLHGLVKPEDFRILPGVLETLKALQEHDYHLVMVTNQDFSRGPRAYFLDTQELLLKTLKSYSIVFDEIFLCPHSPEDSCECRKPKPGMVDTFLKTHTIDASASFVVGDREEADGGLAKNIGVRYIKKDTNNRFPTLEHLIMHT
ncbi:MAG: HAD-IIIA family hydrolase [Candidatus Peribacteraceae bacterium]|nr:HAD-IIIA family hydrolase [Candidatus Peribacteraceae bacterium]